MRRFVLPLVLLCLTLFGCGDDEPYIGAESGAVVVLLPEAADPAVERTVSALEKYVATMVGIAPTVVRLPASASEDDVTNAAEHERAGLAIVIDLAEQGDVAELPDGSYRIVSDDRGTWTNRLDHGNGATFVFLSGASKLADQYAIYELLRRLGARFYHPEQEWVPQVPRAQVRERARTATVIAQRDADGKPLQDYVPDFAARSYTFHGAHPLEHLEAFSDSSFPIDEAEHVEDWIVKNRGNRFRGAGRGIASQESRAARAQELDALRRLMGFPTGRGITLHNQQQGATAVVDPNSSVPPQKQIEDYVDAQLDGAGDDVTEFGIHFGPTEFTVTPDQETVQWIEWAGHRAQAIRPDLRIVVNDHTTGSQPTPNYDDLGCPPGTNSAGRGDYYDLAFHTDPSFGTQVHTVMFYPLEGPAHVYDQVSFAHKLCLMQKASAAGRPLTYFPEGAWWLSFDNPIPAYLPLYIWARHRDIELVRPLLAKNGGTLEGHKMFNSGQEWGYWQQDYAVGIWHWNTDVSMDAVLGEIADPFCTQDSWPDSCNARDTVVQVMNELMDHQKDYLLDKPRVGGKPGGLYTYLAGEDPGDEIAAVTGFEFRPVRTSFNTVMGWDKSQLSDFRFGDQKRLLEMVDAYDDWQARLAAVRPDVPSAGLPWFDEIADGIEIDKLRAQQAEQLYDAVLAYREDTLKGTGDPTARAKEKLAAAAETLTQAETVIRRRETMYRYPPEQEYGGGLTPETAVSNGTTYPYRVHTKTHLLWYWKNRHEQASDIIDGKIGGESSVVLDPVLAPPGSVVNVSWPSIEGLTGSLDLGDGTTVTTADTSHDYPNQEAVWAVSGNITLSGEPLPLKGAVVRANVRAQTAKDGFYLVKPDSDLARNLLATLVPRMHFGWVPGATPKLALIPETRADGKLDFTRVMVASATPASGAFATEPFDAKIPISPPGGGEVTLEVRISGMVVSGDVTPTAFGTELTLAGQMVLDDIVNALIALAGFDEKGAYDTLSGILGFDPDNPPDTVPFEATITVEPAS